MKFKIYTLGCKVNSYESESLKERLIDLGYQEAEKDEESDLFFINTCAVTNEAEKKDLQKTRSVARKFPQAKIVIMGCSSQIHKEKYLAIPQVITVIGNSSKNKVECLLNDSNRDHVNEDSRHFSYEDTPTREGEKNVRGYIKVQDGCNNFCSYCVVPFTRGNSRSRKKDSILKECKDLLNQGIKELIIGGIDTGSYQDPDHPGYDLTSLLKDMLALSDQPYRIRISSIEASQVDEEYIALFRDHKDILCPHFHLPLQSGSQKTLLRMNRKYSLTDFEALVTKIRSEIPEAGISTDVICGFPGETEEDFQETYDFCKRISFMRIHAFPYSERPFTMAAKLSNPIPVRTRMDRVKKLMELSEENDMLFRKKLQGQSVTVLIEEKNKEGKWEGYSENYLRFSIESDENIESSFYSVKII
jgi:MiaB-like protein